MYCAMVASMVIHKNAIRTLCHREPLRLNGDSTYIEGMCARPPRAPTVSPWPEATSISTAPASFEPTCAPTAEATSVHQEYWICGVVEKAQED